MREFVAIVASFALIACSSGDSGSPGIYAPCNGEPGACHLATVQGGASGPESCLCTNYCEVDGDCPLPSTGSVVPTCKPFGDVVVNGHTAACSLPCDPSVTCPNGMECQNGECWARIGK